MSKLLKFLVSLILLIFFSCTENKSTTSTTIININPTQSEIDLREIIILYTNDEHGWIEKTETSCGAANMMGLWRNNENYKGDDSYLILSGGDNWFGTPISNEFKGESTVDVMNTMEYDASAIGNHEFEFGVDNIHNRILHSKFVYLSANIREKSTSNVPPFATPYIIKQVNDVKVGIIGLTTVATPNMTVKEYVEDYEFIDYIEALEEFIPIVKSEGAELLILIAHICYLDLIDISSSLIDFGISIACGGHCHHEMNQQIIKNDLGQLAIIQADYFMKGYAKAEISFDIIGNQIIDLSVGKHLNNETTSDLKVENVVTYWKQKLKELM
jgi:2',3'-cyclic-nucleotide 2'-phosphodiesterase (5'-nucleotidase family)